MTGTSVQIGGVHFGALPDLAEPSQEAQKGHGRKARAPSRGKDRQKQGKNGTSDAHTSFLGRLLGRTNHHKVKVEERISGSRVAEAPAEFLPIPCPPEPCELDTPVISPRPEASGEEESRLLWERLRAAEMHKGPGHTSPMFAFEAHIKESLTRRHRRPPLDLTALAAAKREGSSKGAATRDATWQDPAGQRDMWRDQVGQRDVREEAVGQSGSDQDLAGQGGEEEQGNEIGEHETRGPEELHVEVSDIVEGGFERESGEGDAESTGGLGRAELEAPSASGVAEEPEPGLGSTEGNALNVRLQGSEELQPEVETAPAGLRTGDWLPVTPTARERAAGRPKEFDYERRARAEGEEAGRGHVAPDALGDTWQRDTGPSFSDGGASESEEGRQLSGAQAGPRAEGLVALDDGKEASKERGRLVGALQVEGRDAGYEGKNHRTRRRGLQNGSSASGGIEWWPIGVGNGKTEGSGPAHSQPKGSEGGFGKQGSAGLNRFQSMADRSASIAFLVEQVPRDN